MIRSRAMLSSVFSGAAQAACKIRRRSRRGAVIVLSAFLMIVLIAMVAFAIDTGYILTVRTEMQNAADAGALAGAAAMANGTSAAREAALNYVTSNHVGPTAFDPENVSIEFGQWNAGSRSFVESADNPKALRVLLDLDDTPLFFGRALARDKFDTQAQAIATFQQRDIVVVLDFSASMSYDSQFRSLDRLTQSSIEANLLEIYRELGSPTFGSMQWTPQYNSSSSNGGVIDALGLSRVPYPYAADSWDSYIDYVRNDNSIDRAGYRQKYGYLTWVHYLLAKRYLHSQTPDLVRASAQPVGALKDAVDVFVSHMTRYCKGDRVGLAIYTGPDQTAVLEHGLTTRFSRIADTTRQRQAGHYASATNIYDGMQAARLEIQNNGRSNALRMMVLMTDGQANLPGGTAQARLLILEEAQAALDAKIPIVTIGVGVGADTALLQQVADLTGGVNFTVPGGSSVAEYEQQLKDVFRQVATDRLATLVD